MNKNTINVFWCRRDLRLHDNAALYHALNSANPVLPIFIFDKSILSKLPPDDKRVSFIWQEVKALKEQLEQNYNSSILVKEEEPKEFFRSLLTKYDVKSVFFNRDYEPYAITRDKEVYEFLKENNIEVKAYKDHVILDRNEVLKDNGEPYTVFTPYMKKWKTKIAAFHLKSYPTLSYSTNFYPVSQKFELLSLKEMGFDSELSDFADRVFPLSIIEKYTENRDIPSVKGTSRLGLHLRFGTISIRELASASKNINEKYLNELIWRDFYQMIMYHFPHTTEQSFRPAYDKMEWENDESHFEKWCEGKTGFPLVDAGMRELNETGFMHNRVRMLVASFLTKHLLIDWRWGETYFAEKLLDYDQASNVGGWQWAAGCGVDAAPYFRVFNPTLQQEKFDPDFLYIKKWIPEFNSSSYPEPIVDHKEARLRAIARFKMALS